MKTNLEFNYLPESSDANFLGISTGNKVYLYMYLPLAKAFVTKVKSIRKL